MKVFCFLGPVTGKSAAEELALVDLWKTSWERAGWEPVVLTPDSLPDDAETRARMKLYARLPSRNKRHLDKWCFARWLAVAAAGGGVMSDYDVINYGLAPFEPGRLTIHSGTVPCLVSGTAGEFLRVAAWFDELPPPPLWPWAKREHLSDMVVIQKHSTECVLNVDCKEYGWDEWESAPAVHFSNFSMKPKNHLPRHEWIPRLRPLDETP